MSREQEYQIWRKPVAGPVELERVARGPFVLLTYPPDLPIEEIRRKRQEVLLTQSLSGSNHVLTCHYGTDDGSEQRFEEASKNWQALGVTLQRHMVNAIYATSITTRPRLNIKSA